jgi:sialate O-acetylesterase
MISIIRHAKKAIHKRRLADQIKPISVNKSFAWPDATAGAVSLTYDDGLPCHIKRVAPQLEEAGLSGTFYPHVMSDDFRKHTDAWREIVSRGHELGNHTLFHPCRSNPGISPEFDLRDYGEKRWCAEIELSNWILGGIDGQSERTFGNTCWDNWIGPEEKPICLEQLVRRYFLAARGERREHGIDPSSFNPYNLGTMSADATEFENLKTKIEEVVSAGGWLILSMHGLGKESYSMFIRKADHEQLVEWLVANRRRIWTATLRNVAKHLLNSCLIQTSNK